MARPNLGFTLVELMVAVAVLAVMLALAVPSFTDFFDRSRVRGAADGLVSLIATARGEAVKRSRNVTVSMGGSTTAWCIGANEAATPAAAAEFAASAACDCTSSSECFVDGVRRAASESDFPGVQVSAVTMSFVFDGKLGNVATLDARSVDLTSPAGKYTVRMNVSPLGQSTLCVPSGALSLSGVPSC